MEDAAIIRQYLHSQSTICFSLLYKRYSAKVYSKCISLLKDENLAHDATQEIFTKIFLNLSKFAERAKFSTWVYSITYNYCIDYIRKQKKHLNLFVEDIERTPDVAEEVRDEEILSMNLQQLKEVLETIPLDDKAILLMKYQGELSIKEIADVLGKTESAIKMRIKRAKAKAQQVRKELFPEEDYYWSDQRNWRNFKSEEFMGFQEYGKEEEKEFLASNKNMQIQNNLIQSFGMYRLMGDLVGIFLPKMFSVFVELTRGSEADSSKESRDTDPRVQ